MARDHARLLVSIWTDSDWTALSSREQVLYLAMTSSPDLSWCGVLPLTPARLSALSKDMTEPKVRASILVLERARFILIDAHTAEILVRTYVRHDGILKQPNVTKAMIRALGKVHSPALADAVKDELARELRENADAKGWASVHVGFPELFEELLARGKANPSGKGSRKGSVKGCPTTLPPSPFPLHSGGQDPHQSSSSVMAKAVNG